MHTIDKTPDYLSHRQEKRASRLFLQQYSGVKSIEISIPPLPSCRPEEWVSDATSICRALGLLERSQLVKKESVFALQQQLQRLSHAGKSPSTAQQNVCIGFGLRLSSLYERIPQLTPTDSTALLEERTREVQQIKKGVHEVNALLQELNFFVFRQQSSTDSIENHVNQSVQSHEQTVSLLKKAARRQERLKKMKQRLILWMLLVALVLPAIVAIKRKARL